MPPSRVRRMPPPLASNPHRFHEDRSEIATTSSNSLRDDARQGSQGRGKHGAPGRMPPPLAVVYPHRFHEDRSEIAHDIAQRRRPFAVFIG